MTHIFVFLWGLARVLASWERWRDLGSEPGDTMKLEHDTDELHKEWGRGIYVWIAGEQG